MHEKNQTVAQWRAARHWLFMCRLLSGTLKGLLGIKKVILKPSMCMNALQRAVTCMCVGVLHAPARETSLSAHTASVYRNDRRLGESVLFAEITHMCTASSTKYYISTRMWQPRYQRRLQPIICISGFDDKQSLCLRFVFRVSVYPSMSWLTALNKHSYFYANSQKHDTSY